MKRKILSSLFVIIICTIVSISAIAADKTVQLGETGISFQVDSVYDVITNRNKKDYSKEIQRQVNEDNEMLLYSDTHGSIFVMYDQGNDFLKYDMAGKKTEAIIESYAEYFKALESTFGTTDYDISVYDSGQVKWAKVFVPSISLVWYITCQGKRMVSVYYNWLAADNLKVQYMLDSFNFGSPSFWSKVKSLAGSITSFGRRLLGGYGVYIVWTGIVSISLYLIGAIFTFLGSLFKRKR